MSRSWGLCSALLGHLLLTGAAVGEPPADLILHNGAIWTVDDAKPRATAVAVRGGRFVLVGGDEAALAQRGPQTRVVDLEGKFSLPGFNDSHVHFASAAAFLEFNIMQVSTQHEFVERVREVVGRLEDGEWILGGYWSAYDAWAPGSAGAEGRTSFTPDMRRVEALTARHPMLIRKFDDSAFAANSAALRAVGLDPDRPQAEGIVFERDAEGRLTGILSGAGVMVRFRPHLPKSFSRARRLQQTRRALAEVRAHGVTNVSDMSDDEQLEIYRALRRSGELTCRIHFRYPLDRWGELAERGIKVGSGDEWIRLGGLKGHIDGIMGNSTARFFEPYEHDPTNRGRWRRLMVDDDGDFVEGQFLKFMLDADAAGLQLTVHAIGDEANRLLLDYLETLNRTNGRRDRRFRLVHAQVIGEPDFERLGALGVVAEVQPYHLSDDMRWMEERIGYERCRGAYAFRSIAESGAILSFGTDWPGTSASEYPINPLLGLYAAVTRQTVSGKPAGGWFPEQRITIQEAIKAATWGSAYANFEEDLKGSITVGKLADMAVLSTNLLEVEPAQYLKTEVVYTIVGGKVVYEKARSEGTEGLRD